VSLLAILNYKNQKPLRNEVVFGFNSIVIAPFYVFIYGSIRCNRVPFFCHFND